MTGLPHQRRYHSQDFIEPRRVRGLVTVLAIVIGACVMDYVWLVIGIHIGREEERAEQLRRKAVAAVDATKPVYGARLFACTKEERREYLEACRQRLRSNLTGGM